MNQDQFAAQRVRHPIKIRQLQIKRITELSPFMRRITLTGDDLPGFVSASFDDHIKLLVPQQKGEVPVMPTLGDKGLVFPDGQPLPAMRDYTPRRYDALTNRRP